MKPGTCERIEVDDLAADVTYKATRRIYLRVKSVAGPVQLSVPWRLSRETVNRFLREQIPWIERQREKHRQRKAVPSPTYCSGETLWLWGHPYPMVRIDRQPSGVELADGAIRLRVPADAPVEACARLIDAWYKERMLEALAPLVAQWATRLRIPAPRLRVRKMKSRWGSCSLHTRTATFNLELVKRPPACLDYIVLHELVHLIVRPHNARFYLMLDRHLPQWSDVRRELNAQPIAGPSA